MKKTFTFLSLLLTLVFCVSVSAIEADAAGTDDADLQIKTETITQREYAGTAVADKYGIEILTEESYEQASRIAAMQEQSYQTTQAALSFTNDKENGADAVAETAERLGLFDGNYEASGAGSIAPKEQSSILWIVIVLAVGVCAGVGLAIVLNKLKNGVKQ